MVVVLISSFSLLIKGFSFLRWPTLLGCIFIYLCTSFQAKAGDKTVGVVVCKTDGEICSAMEKRGYIAMLAVDTHHRRRGIGNYNVTVIAGFQQTTDTLHFSSSP